MTALGLKHRPVDDVSDHAREKDYESVYDTLNERQGNHVPVGDVANLVSENGLHLIASHMSQ